MPNTNEPGRNRTDYNAMSTPALKELLKHDLRGDLLDVETVSIVMHILTERTEQEDPDSIPPIDLEWKSFRENYLSVKAHIRRFMRRVLPKILIVLAVLAVVAAILWLGNLPLFTESLTDTVTLKDGHFTVSGFRAGMTRAEVIDWLEEQGLPYTSSDVDTFWKSLTARPPISMMEHPEHAPVDVSWISIRGNTRIEELGKVSVRRTYYFTDGLLKYVDLEAAPLRGNIRNSVRSFRLLALTAELSFGEPRDVQGNVWTPYDFTTPGTDRVVWQGADGSSLELYGRYYRQFESNGSRIEIVYSNPEDSVAVARNGKIYRTDSAAGKFIDLFELRIRITLS